MKACEAHFPKTLRYESPAHGGWGIIKIASQVPESYLLFFAPPACGRHGCLSSFVSGIKDKVSYVFFTEEEIVNGTYVNAFIPSVKELLDFLPKRPKCLFLYTSCIDDMLGTDRPSIRRELEGLYPDIRFRFFQMDPIKLDSASAAPGVSLYCNMFSMLEGETKKPDTHQVNLIGNVVEPDYGSELFTFLKEAGVTSIRQIPTMRKFDEFLSMADSALNLVVHPRAMAGARLLEKQNKIPLLEAFTSYDPDDIDRFYQELAQRLGSEPFKTKPLREKAEAKLDATAKELDDIPIAIDFQAVTRPYTLAKVLLQHGFNVRLIASDGVAGMEKPALGWISEHHPDVEVTNPLFDDAPKYAYRKTDGGDLAIGFDCGFMVGSSHVADMIEDDGYFGYKGIERLCDRLLNARGENSDVQRMIKEANLVV